MNNKSRINKAREILIANGEITENENIYTKNVWRKMGYKVNKDESPVAIVPIYVFAPYKMYDKTGKCVKTGKMIGIRSNFYKQSQVTEIQKGAYPDKSA